MKRYLLTVVLFAGSVLGAGMKLNTIHNFTGLGDGGYPMTGLIFDNTGALYGTSSIGGDFEACDEGGQCGVIFKLTPPAQSGGDWMETELYDFFNPGPYPPNTPLVFDGQNNLYGGAGPTSDGAGYFQLTGSNGNWTLNNIYYINNDVFPGVGRPLLGKKNNMYVLGGGNYGSVVELTRNPNNTWTSITLYTFLAGNDGGMPVAGVVGDHAGNLYGTTNEGGGSADCGTVYELSPQSGGSWSETILHSFTGSDGCLPYAGVILDSKGNLYGAAATGGTGPCGSSGCGLVYELSPPAEPGGSWTYTILHSFASTDGVGPISGLTMSSSGVLYGTTNGGGGGPCEPTGAGCGTVYRLTPPANAGGAWTEDFVAFNGANGTNPFGSVLLDESTGVLYGTTRVGGVYGYGTVFQVVP